jgi:protein required for attachment to host cells
MKKNITWVILADGQRARFLVHDAIGKGINLVDHYDFAIKIPASHEIGSDKPGRVFDRMGEGRHHTGGTDLHEKQETIFLKTIADKINRKAEAKAFDRLILIAPPHTLGLLRQELSEQATAQIVAEIPKDLFHVSENSLLAYLGQVMAV